LSRAGFRERSVREQDGHTSERLEVEHANRDQNGEPRGPVAPQTTCPTRTLSRPTVPACSRRPDTRAPPLLWLRSARRRSCRPMRSPASRTTAGRRSSQNSSWVPTATTYGASAETTRVQVWSESLWCPVATTDTQAAFAKGLVHKRAGGVITGVVGRRAQGAAGTRSPAPTSPRAGQARGWR